MTAASVDDHAHDDEHQEEGGDQFEHHDPPAAVGDPELIEIAEEAESSHTYVSGCSGCAARQHCYGVNTSYLRQFGESEFKGLTPAEWATRNTQPEAEGAIVHHPSTQGLQALSQLD